MLGDVARGTYAFLMPSETSVAHFNSVTVYTHFVRGADDLIEPGDDGEGLVDFNVTYQTRTSAMEIWRSSIAELAQRGQPGRVLRSI